MDNTGTPPSSNGLPNSGFKPYETPATIPAAKPNSVRLLLFKMQYGFGAAKVQNIVQPKSSFELRILP